MQLQTFVQLLEISSAFFFFLFSIGLSDPLLVLILVKFSAFLTSAK